MTSRAPVLKLPRLSGVPRRQLNAILLFGVAFVIGAAPFLGAKRIPGFAPLISVFPERFHTILIPISGILFSVVALAVRFFSDEALTRRGVRRIFTILCVVVAAAAIGLLALWVAYVHEVAELGKTFVIGWSQRPGCTCPPGDVADCILGVAQEVDACWRGVFQVKLALFLCYLVAVEGFGVLAGLLVIRPDRRSSEKPAGKRARRKRGGPATGGGGAS